MCEHGKEDNSINRYNLKSLHHGKRKTEQSTLINDYTIIITYISNTKQYTGQLYQTLLSKSLNTNLYKINQHTTVLEISNSPVKRIDTYFSLLNVEINKIKTRYSDLYIISSKPVFYGKYVFLKKYITVTCRNRKS